MFLFVLGSIVHHTKTKVMGLYDFLMLSEEEKKMAVLHIAILLEKRRVGDELWFLFQLNNFYIEAQCDYVNKSVLEYRVSHTTKLIEPYLDNIPISGLFR